MPTKSFPARPLAKALACTPLLLSLSACSSHPAPADDGHNVLQVLTTSPARLLENPESAGKLFPPACHAWQLGHDQVAQFFALASQYPHLPYHRFDHLPCEIAGELLAEGQRWHFRINAAGTASWQRQGQVRHFACTTQACEPLVLMLPEPGDP